MLDYNNKTLMSKFYYREKRLTTLLELIDVKARFGGLDSNLIPHVQSISGDNGDRSK